MVRCSEHVAAKTMQLGGPSQPQVRQAEDVFNGTQQAVVVVGRSRDRAGRDEARQQHGPHGTATRTEFARRWAAGKARLPTTGSGIAALVEGDHKQPVLAEGWRLHDARHPCAQKAIGRDQPAGFSVGARCIVAVMAEPWDDVRKIGRCIDLFQIAFQFREIDDVFGAICLVVGDGMEVDKGSCLSAYSSDALALWVAS